MGYAVWRSMRTTGTPYFLYVHGMLDPANRQVFPLKHWQKWLHWTLIEHRVARCARAVLFTCHEEARKAAISFRPYQVKPEIVPCCVASPPPEQNGAREAFYERWPDVRDKRVLLFLGRLNRKKGCDLLIESFGRLASRDPKLHLVIAGPAEHREWVSQLRLRARTLGLQSRVTWTGPLAGEMKWSAFRTADAFILPSHSENFGIAVVEALACGTPVLISNHVDIWREILDERAGLVAEVGLSGTLDLIERWRSLPADDRDRMRLNASNCYTHRFWPDAAATRLVDVLSG